MRGIQWPVYNLSEERILLLIWSLILLRLPMIQEYDNLWIYVLSSRRIQLKVVVWLIRVSSWIRPTFQLWWMSHLVSFTSICKTTRVLGRVFRRPTNFASFFFLLFGAKLILLCNALFWTYLGRCLFCIIALWSIL